MMSERHFLCIHLKCWPTDRVLRRRRQWAQARIPLVLIQTSGSRQVLSAVSPAALSLGIRVGMTLAQARSLCAAVVHLDHDPEADQRGMEALGRWLVRFSPVVALEPPDGIYVDITGCERLFGGIAAIVGQVWQAMRHLRIHASVVVAPTPGAAWAIACSQDGIRPGPVVQADQLLTMLNPLPVGVLRIEPAADAALHRLGIETIGQLMKLPREKLPVRFGNELLRRLDQAMGRIAEPLRPLSHHAPLSAEMELDSPIDSLEAIWIVLKELIGRLIPELARRGCGVRQIKATFRPPYSAAVEKTIHLSRPSRDAANLFNLLRCAIESTRVEEGFTLIRLDIPGPQRVEEEQIPLLEHEEHIAETELTHLIERLRARLNWSVVEQAKLVECYVPERAFVAGSTDTLLCKVAPPFKRHKAAHGAALLDKPTYPRAGSARPLHLLACPMEIAAVVSPCEDREGRPVSFTYLGRVHRLRLAVGPERIGGVWWDGHNKTRDYFDAEDTAGGRFWIFRVRETFKWYLHGYFE
jgi:protein ImuB